MNRIFNAKKAIRQIALQEGVPVEEVRKQMQLHRTPR